jgi:hypothetical protein
MEQFLTSIENHLGAVILVAVIAMILLDILLEGWRSSK